MPPDDASVSNPHRVPRAQHDENGRSRDASALHGPTYRLGAIISARSGESEGVTIAHLAIGWGVQQLKVGSFARSERMAKWNEVLRIEEALGPRARFAGRTPLVHE